MSVRAANYPLSIPSGVEVNLKDREVTVKGVKGVMSFTVHPAISVEKTDQGLRFSQDESGENKKFLGTSHALVKNMMKGVSEGFEKKLELVGVGYRAQVNGNKLELVLGFSHPVHFPVPEGITVNVEKQTSISIQGIDKQKVGQVAAKIKAFRPVEPYKGKGVRYSDQVVIKKEVKKK